MNDTWAWVKHGCAFDPHVDGLVQERCNSIANALELRLSCTDPWYVTLIGHLLCVFVESWQFYIKIWVDDNQDRINIQWQILLRMKMGSYCVPQLGPRGVIPTIYICFNKTKGGPPPGPPIPPHAGSGTDIDEVWSCNIPMWHTVFNSGSLLLTSWMI